jgi:hypothetical protein
VSRDFYHFFQALLFASSSRRREARLFQSSQRGNLPEGVQAVLPGGNMDFDMVLDPREIGSIIFASVNGISDMQRNGIRVVLVMQILLNCQTAPPGTGI